MGYDSFNIAYTAAAEILCLSYWLPQFVDRLHYCNVRPSCWNRITGEKTGGGG